MYTNAIPIPHRTLIRTAMKTAVVVFMAFAGGQVRAQTTLTWPGAAQCVPTVARGDDPGSIWLAGGDMASSADRAQAPVNTTELLPVGAHAPPASVTADPSEQSVLSGGGLRETAGGPASRSLFIIFAATAVVLISGARRCH